MKLHLNVYEYWNLLQMLEMFEVAYGDKVKNYSELIQRIKGLEKQIDNE